MCLILFGIQTGREYDLVLAANRDEFYSRPTDPMHFWDAPPGLLAGKDLEQGGTWLGINRHGQFAALTNYRDPASLKSGAPSRGNIIPGFLCSTLPDREYIRELEQTAGEYNGYNLLFGSGKQLYWFCNVNTGFKRIEPGVHGLSNRFLDTPWPKVETGKTRLKDILDQSKGNLKDRLFDMLLDRDQPGDASLPETGIGLEWERILSPMFIESENYGTRSSTVLLIDKTGNVEVTERTYESGNSAIFTERSFSFRAG